MLPSMDITKYVRSYGSSRIVPCGAVATKVPSGYLLSVVILASPGKKVMEGSTKT